MTAIPIVLFWTLALHGLFSRKPMLVYLFFATMPVGAFAVIPTSLTGGLTFTPTPVIALLLIARTFSDRDGPAAFLALALLPHRLMLLTLFWAAAAVTTLFMPRLFAGKVMVVPIRGIVSAAAPLQSRNLPISLSRSSPSSPLHESFGRRTSGSTHSRPCAWAAASPS